MKSFKAAKRILAVGLAFALTFTSAGFTPLTAYAAEKTVDESLLVPFGLVASYDSEQGFGVVWGAAGYDLYTVTISAKGYSKTYEDQTLSFHYYPDEYVSGEYYVSVQGQVGDTLSKPVTADPITVVGLNPADPETPGEEEPETPGGQGSETPGEQGSETPGEQQQETPGEQQPEIPAEAYAFTAVSGNLAVSVEGKHEDWVEYSNAVVANKAGGATLVITGYEGYEAYQSRVEQAGLTFEAGKNYVIRYDIISSKNKTTMLRADDLNNNYSLLFDDFRYTVKGGERTTVTAFTGKLNAGTVNARVFAGLGMVEPNDDFKAGDHTVSVENFEIYEIAEDLPHSIFTAVKAGDTAETGEFIDLEKQNTELYVGTDWAGANATYSEDGTTVTFDVASFGWSGEWGLQYIIKDLGFLDNKTYTIEFDITSTVDKTFFLKLDDVAGFIAEPVSLTADTTLHYKKEVSCGAFCAEKPYIFFALGQMNNEAGARSGLVTLSNLKITGERNPVVPIVIEPVVGPEYDFNDNSGDHADPGLEKAGYTLIWNDEFDGNYGGANVDANTGLNLDKWAYQLGDGSTDCGNYGWGNNELQAYTNERKNIAVNEDLTGDGVADGLLRITASYEANGYTYASESKKNYTSARIRTTSPSGEIFNLTYGYIEARMAMPATQGAWPAFWMLPESTEIYGGWPVSGELDIMESTAAMIGAGKACGTLHWGTPSHVYKGSGDVQLDSPLTYFHTYAVDWQPGKITWYYDGEAVYTSADWESTVSGASGALSFDAPFDQPFYLLLNLAIDSGNFGGNANKANFLGDINMYIDYVRAYQLTEGYADHAVREAQGTRDNWAEYADINQIAEIKADNLVPTTGGHDDNAAIGTGKWYLSTQSDADASAEVYTDADGRAWHKVNVTKAGGNDYSVQLIGHYDAKKGYVYRVSFSAFAEGDIKGKTVNCDSKEYASWGTYGVQSFALTDTKTAYSYTFQQTADFNNCRIEFNLGAAATGSVYISDVKVEIVDPALLGVSESGRKALPDGNMIYNSSFDQGSMRLGYWTAGANTEVTVPRYTVKKLTADDVKVVDIASKTNYEGIADGVKYYERRANIKADKGVAPVIYQAGIPMIADEYTVNFDLYSETDTAVRVSALDSDGREVAYKTVAYTKGSGVRNIIVSLQVNTDLGEGTLKFAFAKGTEVQLDNVSMFGKNQGPAVDETPVGGEKETTWRGDNGGGAELVLDRDGEAYKLSNIVSGGNWYSPQIGSSNFSVAAGVKYRFSYKYKTDLASHKYIVQQNGTNWIVIFGANEVKTDIGHADEEGFYCYETEFVAGTSLDDCHLNFGFGDSGANGNYFLFKDVTLTVVKAEVPAGEADDDEVDDSLFEDDKEPAEEGSQDTKPAEGTTPAPTPGESTTPAPGSDSGTPAAPTEGTSNQDSDNTPAANDEAGDDAETENTEIEDEDAPLAGEIETEDKNEEKTEETSEETSHADTKEDSEAEAPQPENTIADEEVALADKVAEEGNNTFGILLAVVGALALCAAGTLAYIRLRKKES